MCDSLVILPSYNTEKSTILAKNSDREPDEVQLVAHYPAKKHSKAMLQCTYIEIPQVEQTYEVILSKPYQMWGAEMGVNEHGVSIANEAVFTKISIPKKNTGLTGMDLLRLGLERSTTAKEALETIIQLLEKHGQDACGGYKDKSFYYHNSFLIADGVTAFLLDTASTSWAWKPVENFQSISNQLNITTDYSAYKMNVELPWYKLAKKETPFNFKKYYSDFLYTNFSNAEKRKSCSLSILKELKDHTTPQNCFDILKSHNVADADFSLKKASTADLCMHATNFINRNSTTGSMVAIIRKDSISTIWVTATAHPCLSVYVPFYFGEKYISTTNEQGKSIWWLAKNVQDWICKNYAKRKPLIREELDDLQAKFLESEKSLFEKNASPKAIKEFSENCLNEVMDFWKGKQYLVN